MDKDLKKPVEVREAHASAHAEHLLHPMEQKSQKKSMNTVVIILVYVILIGLGVGTGYMLSQKSETTGVMSGTSPSTAGNTTEEAKTNGGTDASCPTGMLEAGGIDGEGTHKLIRDGGPSQTAYLTSSVVDLDEYVGKKVRVCGETLAAKKAGWLMDVQKIDVQ